MPTDLFLFSDASSVDVWTPVDDRVMGGCSTSRLRYDFIGHAVFEGTVKLENRGGFASVRTQPMYLGVKNASAYVLGVNGDGRRYKFTLRLDDSFDGVTYQSSFAPPAGVWTSVHLPISQFIATFRGRPVPDASGLDPSRVRQLGFMISEQQVGDFSLRVNSVGTI